MYIFHLQSHYSLHQKLGVKFGEKRYKLVAAIALTAHIHTHIHEVYKVALQVHNKCIKNIQIQMIYIANKGTNSKFLQTRFYL